MSLDWLLTVFICLVCLQDSLVETCFTGFLSQHFYFSLRPSILIHKITLTPMTNDANYAGNFALSFSFTPFSSFSKAVSIDVLGILFTAFHGRSGHAWSISASVYNGFAHSKYLLFLNFLFFKERWSGQLCLNIIGGIELSDLIVSKTPYGEKRLSKLLSDSSLDKGVDRPANCLSQIYIIEA